MANAVDLARYFLKLAATEEEPEHLTQIHLHKLLYFAQGWTLALRGERLFKGRIEAWKDGPVARGVYPIFADYGSQPIAHHEAGAEDALSPDERAIAQSIWRGYGRYSAWALREMTHAQDPWIEARGGVPDGACCDEEITIESMKRYFGRLAKESAIEGLDPETIAEADRDFVEGRAKKLSALPKPTNGVV